MGSSYYLKFGDIRGDVTEPAYRSWIELKSWSWGQRGSSGGLGDWISCYKERDSASTALAEASAHGKVADAVIDAVRESGGVYLRLEMSNAMISSFLWNPQGEGLSIAYEKIETKIEPGTPPP
ncbi:MAG: type VI secretion system tube protein Hcp [Thermoanaerobaculia bacterium]